MVVVVEWWWWWWCGCKPFDSRDPAAGFGKGGRGLAIEVEVAVMEVLMVSIESFQTRSCGGIFRRDWE